MRRRGRGAHGGSTATHATARTPRSMSTALQRYVLPSASTCAPSEFALPSMKQRFLRSAVCTVGAGADADAVTSAVVAGRSPAAQLIEARMASSADADVILRIVISSPVVASG